jgi:hypothetical protein
MLHKTGKISRKLFLLFVVIFIIIGLLHTKLFDIKYLMTFGRFLLVAQFTATIIIFHFIGTWFIGRTKKANQLPEQSIQLIVNLTNLIFLKGIYVFFFILQCMYIYVNAT